MSLTLFNTKPQSDDTQGGSIGGAVKQETTNINDGPALVDLSIKLKPKEALQVMIQMRAMLSAGVPLLAAMRTLIEHATTAESEKVLRKISSVVENGHDLSYAFDCLPNCFEKYVVHLLAAGEQAGALDESLDRGIELLSNQIKLGGQIKGALTYPGFLIFATFLMTLNILYFIVPKFESLMMKRPDQLPWTTKLVLSSSQTLHAAPELVFGSIAIIIVALIVAVKSKKSRAVLFDLASKSPVVGDLIFKSYLSRSVGTLALTLESGVPILTGLEHARQVSELPRLKEKWAETAATVRDGRPMHTALCGDEMPPALTQMIVAGESSGSLDTSLRKAAVFLDEETQAALKAFTTLLGPATVILAGAAVGFIVVALMTPILTMSKYVG
ncbi:MAG: type II secretory pathway component PulF [Myxococcota bacterium]|jgi:type II secretory pathway component PulF